MNKKQYWYTAFNIKIQGYHTWRSFNRTITLNRASPNRLINCQWYISLQLKKKILSYKLNNNVAQGRKKVTRCVLLYFYNLLKWWLLISINSVDPSTKEPDHHENQHVKISDIAKSFRAVGQTLACENSRLTSGGFQFESRPMWGGCFRRLAKHMRNDRNLSNAKFVLAERPTKTPSYSLFSV